MQRMMRLAALSIVLFPLLSGCGDLSNLFAPSETTVALVNDGSFPVEVKLYTHTDQNVLEALITAVGTERNYTIPAGETRVFTFACDDVQAIYIDDAELSLIGDIGPSQNSDQVYRDGSDFNCGDTILFTFTHPTLPTSLSIEFSVN